jgi:predicted RNA binding protein YcfA (HicA-like mRNA interferase family)
MQPARLLERIRRGNVGNIDFGDLVRLVMALGFREVSGRGSHRVFARTGVRELVNLQAQKGQAKAYQVRQIATLVRQYDLELEDEV